MRGPDYSAVASAPVGANCLGAFVASSLLPACLSSAVLFLRERGQALSQVPACSKHAGRSARATQSKDQFQGKLDLSGGVGGVGLHEVLWLLVVARVGSIADFGRALYEGRSVCDQAV